MNRILVEGNLGKDAESLATSSGMQVCKFSVADTYKPKSGEPTTTWFNVVCFGDVADGASKLIKGQRVLVEGRFEEKSYTKKDGSQGKSSSVIASNVYVTVAEKKPKAEKPAPSAQGDDFFGDIPF